MKRYYDLHINYDNNNGFSIPFELESETPLNDNEVIDYAFKNGIIDNEDAKNVDDVRELTKEEFLNLVV